VTVDVDELEVGQARGWDRTRDVGSGSIHTRVYPVRTVWTRRIFLRTRTVVQAHESIFDCYVSGLGQWACASSRNVKPPEVTRVPAK
jgi:hypothetical protein